MLLFSKIYEFYCLYGIEILLSGATGAARQNSYEGLHIFSYEELFRTFYHFLSLFPNCSHFFQLFLNSSYEALIYILLLNLSHFRKIAIVEIQNGRGQGLVKIRNKKLLI